MQYYPRSNERSAHGTKHNRLRAGRRHAAGGQDRRGNRLVKDILRPKDGTATLRGKTYILVDTYYLPDPRGEGKSINAVAEDAPERIGYFDMTLLRVPKNWKRGTEVLEAIPNGDYDYFMCEQKGWFTPPRGYRGARCHDC